MNTVADFVKQGWDPAQAAILVEVQKGVTVEWSLQVVPRHCLLERMGGNGQKGCCRGHALC